MGDFYTGPTPQLPPDQQTNSSEIDKQSNLIIELRRTDPKAMALFVDFADRCIAFSEKYHTDTLPKLLSSLIWNAFQEGSDKWLMLVALDSEGKIVAHLLADIESYGILGDVVFVIQIEKDIQNSNIMREGFEMLQNWRDRHNIKHILNLGLSEAHARLYEKEYGFKVYRYLLKLDMES